TRWRSAQTLVLARRGQRRSSETHRIRRCPSRWYHWPICQSPQGDLPSALPSAPCATPHLRLILCVGKLCVDRAYTGYLALLQRRRAASVRSARPARRALLTSGSANVGRLIRWRRVRSQVIPPARLQRKLLAILRAYTQSACHIGNLADDRRDAAHRAHGLQRRRDTAGPRREEQFIVVAAGQRDAQRIAPQRLRQRAGGAVHWQRRQLDQRADAAALTEVSQ